MTSIGAWLAGRLPGIRGLGFAVITGVLAGGIASETLANATLTPPDEIIRIMEASTLSYVIQAPTAPEEGQIGPGRVLMPGLMLKQQEGAATLAREVLPPALDRRLDEAEERFQRRDFEGAIEIYEEVLETDPTSYQALILIGDAHFSMGQMSVARRYFEKAIESNFIDYQAHWFLADALWSLGYRDQALDEIVVAHLLNVNHTVLKDAMIAYHKRLNQNRRDWGYEPSVQLRKQGNTVYVGCSNEWLGYCVVKAVWEYEPGYVESKGEENQLFLLSLQEKEALGALLVHNEKLSHIREIVSDGFADEFLYYEVIARKFPHVVLLLPRANFLRLKAYVLQYH